MKAENQVKVTNIKQIEWQGYIATIENGNVDVKGEGILGAQIQADPEGFYAFAGLICDALNDSKPPDPPKVRKTRSDKGISKKKQAEGLNDLS